MNIRKLSLSLLISFLLSIVACGYGEDNGSPSFYLSGTVITEKIEGDITGPILVMVTNTDDLEKIEEDPNGAIIKVITVDESDLTFRVDLTDEGLKKGDKIYITAFVDNDYSGNIPYPTAGDYVGFYVDMEGLSMAYVLKSGKNDGIEIEISREVFDFDDTTISGMVYGSEGGELTVLAYAGDVTSSDFSKLDTDGIIGYRKLPKDDGPVSYTLDILPYGYDVPVANVYVFAFLDVNENGEVDGGDRIGYYTTEENNLPTLLTVNEGTTEDIGVNFYMDVMEPYGLDISLAGTFTPPFNYNEESPPMFVIVAETDNLDTLFDDPIAAIKYFEKMPPGDFIFDIDLSETDLLPGDDVMVFALWDRDYVAGFPNPTGGDKIGLLQNKESYAFSIELEYGVNPIPAEGYELELTKNVYDSHDFDYDSKKGSIKYTLDIEGAGSYDPERAQFIVMAIHVGGVTINLSDGMDLRDVIQIDMDYILGVKVVPAAEYSEDPGNLNILPAIYNEISVNVEDDPPEPLIEGEGYDPAEPETVQFDERTAYLVVILDKDGDGELDFDNDEIGYYCSNPTDIDETTIEDILRFLGLNNIPDFLTYLYGTYYMPTPIQRITKGENLDDTEPYAIKFYGLSLDPE
ncbi:MAG: hypothetical protein E4H39_00085 [Syntrophobacterales bacterium]|nr:MAG: hypothetical protein E4H39_00085 [Syntrophobacterales bacterium]